ncbi:MAG: zinc-binding dehydrogenase [Anaerolineales bacterium]|jgi:threonine dehydrogenase-like Zn-dependent dehydrogenase
MVKTGKAALLHGPMKGFTIEAAPVPSPGPGRIIVRIELCGICGTDVHFYKGHLPSEISYHEGIPYPLVLGHEPAATIEELGDGVGEDFTGRPIQPGDRVFIASLISCNRCYFCLVESQPAMCQNLKSYSHKPFPDEPPHFQGAYAQYMDLKDNFHVLRLDGVDPRAAVMLEPLACGLHAVDNTHFKSPAFAVIQGSGPIGLATMVAAKESGAYKTLVIGAPAERLEIAKTLGADFTLNIDEVDNPQERVEWVRAHTPFRLGADVVFEATGAPQAVPEGVEMLRGCGQYITLGHFTDNGDVMINPFKHFTANEITLRGVWGSHQALYVRAREIIESHKYPLEEIVTHQIPLDKIENTFHQMTEGYALDGEVYTKVAVAPWD